MFTFALFPDLEQVLSVTGFHGEKITLFSMGWSFTICNVLYNPLSFNTDSFPPGSLRVN